MENIMKYLLMFIAMFLASSIALTIVLKRKRKVAKRETIKVSTDFLSNLETLLGGRGNVKEVTNDGGRIKFILEDIKKADLESLKSLAKSGILVSGNTIKILFEYSTEHVITYFE